MPNVWNSGIMTSGRLGFIRAILSLKSKTAVLKSSNFTFILTSLSLCPIIPVFSISFHSKSGSTSLIGLFTASLVSLPH
jgi:hypothetical protein